jgi:hypothetical protein
MVVDNVLRSCCGSNDLIGNLMNHLPFGKKNNEEEEVADTGNKPEVVKPEFVKPVTTPASDKKTSKGKFADKHMKYEFTVWKDLPMKVRNAARELGYDQEKWDNDSEEGVPVADKHWRDLTEEEKKAVDTLGWDEDAWENKYEDHGTLCNEYYTWTSFFCVDTIFTTQ